MASYHSSERAKKSVWSLKYVDAKNYYFGVSRGGPQIARKKTGTYPSNKVFALTRLSDSEISRLALFFNAMKLVRTDGRLAFNIKENFLDASDRSEEFLEKHAIE